MSNQQATKFLVMNCIDYLSISLCGCKWHFHEKKRKKEYTLNVTWMTFSDFISSNNIIIASNRCSRSGWIFFLAPVVKPDLVVDYACTQLVKFEEFFVKVLSKDKGIAFSSKAKKSQLVHLFNAAHLNTSGRPSCVKVRVPVATLPCTAAAYFNTTAVYIPKFQQFIFVNTL